MTIATRALTLDKLSRALGSAPAEYAVLLHGERIGSLFRDAGRHDEWRAYAGWGSERHYLGSYRTSSPRRAVDHIASYVGSPARFDG